MNIEDLKVGDRVLMRDGEALTICGINILKNVFAPGGVGPRQIQDIITKIHETDLPTDGAPDWYRGKPVYCEASNDKGFSLFIHKGFCLFSDDTPSYGLLDGTDSGDIKDWDGDITWFSYARPTELPIKQAKYYILKKVDGKSEEKYELTDEQMEVLGLE